MHDYNKRFKDLVYRGSQIPIHESEWERYVEPEVLYQWISSSLNLIEQTFGRESTIFGRFVTQADDRKYLPGTLEICRGLLRSAQEEYEMGFLRGLRHEISDEFVIDACLRAERLLSENFPQPAAVLAAAALEDCFRRKAEDAGCSKPENGLTENINALKGAGKLSGPTAKIVAAFPKFRNSAMHASWGDITNTEILTVCAFLKAYVMQP